MARNKSNVLILKDNNNSFEEFYINSLRHLKYDARYYYNQSGKLRKLFTHLGLPFESMFYGEWKKHILEFDAIIVFDSIHSTKIIEYLHRNGAKRIIYWHWNPIKTNTAIRLIEKSRKICENWTFNPLDAEKYNMHLSTQFYFYQNDSKVESGNGIFFVGANKGRYKQLIDLKEQLNRIGCRTNFRIVVNSLENNMDSSICSTNYMDYEETITNIQNADALLEINQEGQTGLTVRALEAIFHGKKLITDNKDLKNYEFYMTQNIYILGDDKRSLESFMKERYEPIDSKLLYEYSGDGWVESFNI